MAGLVSSGERKAEGCRDLVPCNPELEIAGRIAVTCIVGIVGSISCDSKEGACFSRERIINKVLLITIIPWLSTQYNLLEHVVNA